MFHVVSSRLLPSSHLTTSYACIQGDDALREILERKERQKKKAKATRVISRTKRVQGRQSDIVAAYKVAKDIEDIKREYNKLQVERAATKKRVKREATLERRREKRQKLIDK